MKGHQIIREKSNSNHLSLKFNNNFDGLWHDPKIFIAHIFSRGYRNLNESILHLLEIILIKIKGKIRKIKNIL